MTFIIAILVDKGYLSNETYNRLVNPMGWLDGFIIATVIYFMIRFGSK